ncbi:MAG: SPFH domain-containing protein, partial [Anaerolineales bacterium]
MAPLLGYYKSDPTDYVLLYGGGKVRRAGAGIAFYYWAPTASIVSIPISTVDVPFILSETTGNFQAITVQGQLTYRIANPQTMAGILNFTVDPRSKKFISTDPEKVSQRIINVIQAHLRAELAKLALEEALRGAAEIGAHVLAKVKTDPT